PLSRRSTVILACRDDISPLILKLPQTSEASRWRISDHAEYEPFFFVPVAPAGRSCRRSAGLVLARHADRVGGRGAQAELYRRERASTTNEIRARTRRRRQGRTDEE